MSNGTKVVKRNGSLESLDLNKLHLMVEEACKDLAGVSASQVEMQSGIQFYDGITTAEVQEILIRSASDLIDLDHPNYQFVAARLLLFALRKQLFGRMHECPTIFQHIQKCVKCGVYDEEILKLYTEEEIEKFSQQDIFNRVDKFMSIIPRENFEDGYDYLEIIFNLLANDLGEEGMEEDDEARGKREVRECATQSIDDSASEVGSVSSLQFERSQKKRALKRELLTYIEEKLDNFEADDDV